MSKGTRTLIYLLAAGLCYAFATLFSLRAGEILSGYILPGFAPPHWIAPFIWPVMLILIVFGLSAPEAGSGAARRAVRCYLVWLGLFVLWAVLFYRMGMLTAAAVTGLFSWGVLQLCMRSVKEANPRQARLLLIPVVWTGYCVTVNLAVALMN